MSKRERGDCTCELNDVYLRIDSNCPKHRLRTDRSEKTVSKLKRELELRKRFMDRLPLCPDHRDKVAGERCLKCQLEETDHTAPEPTPEPDEPRTIDHHPSECYGECPQHRRERDDATPEERESLMDQPMNFPDRLREEEERRQRDREREAVEELDPQIEKMDPDDLRPEERGGGERVDRVEVVALALFREHPDSDVTRWWSDHADEYRRKARDLLDCTDDLRSAEIGDSEEWRRAAIQAKDDLRAIAEAFAEATPVGEDGPDPPIAPGHRFAEWTSPANTMRWIKELEARERPTPEADTDNDWSYFDWLDPKERWSGERGRIAEIRERVEAVIEQGQRLPGEEYPTPCCYWTNGDREGEAIDTEFIKHSVGDILWLLDRIERPTPEGEPVEMLKRDADAFDRAAGDLPLDECTAGEAYDRGRAAGIRGTLATLDLHRHPRTDRPEEGLDREKLEEEVAQLLAVADNSPRPFSEEPSEFLQEVYTRARTTPYPERAADIVDLLVSHLRDDGTGSGD